MANFAQLIARVVREADIILFVIDAREPHTAVNGFLDTLLRKHPNKKILYVINKIDLVPESAWKKLRRELQPSIAVSATEHLGTMMLLRKVNEIAHGEEALVGVIGYPNTGKSSLINALKGRGSTSTSPVAGHTRALQKIRVSTKVVLIDAPGILPREDLPNSEKRAALALVGTVDIAKVKEPDLLAIRLLTEHPGILAQYGVDTSLDPEEQLAALAVAKNLLRAGGVPDIERAARAALSDYQRGKKH